MLAFGQPNPLLSHENILQLLGCDNGSFYMLKQEANTNCISHIVDNLIYYQFQNNEGKEKHKLQACSIKCIIFDVLHHNESQVDQYESLQLITVLHNANYIV